MARSMTSNRATRMIQSTSEYPFTLVRLPPMAQVVGSEPFPSSPGRKLLVEGAAVFYAPRSRPRWPVQEAQRGQNGNISW